MVVMPIVGLTLNSQLRHGSLSTSCDLVLILAKTRPEATSRLSRLDTDGLSENRSHLEGSPDDEDDAGHISKNVLTAVLRDVWQLAVVRQAPSQGKIKSRFPDVSGSVQNSCWLYAISEPTISCRWLDAQWHVMVQPAHADTRLQ